MVHASLKPCLTNKETNTMSSKITLTTLVASMLLATTAVAGPEINFTASASNNIKNDLYTAEMSYETNGATPQEVSERTNAVLKRTIESFKKDQSVRARVGNVYVNPQYKPNGKLATWVMRGEVSLDSNSPEALSTEVARLQQTLILKGIGSKLSEKLKSETELATTEEAIKRFRTNASSIANTMGARYHIVSMNINTAGSVVPPHPLQLTSAKSMSITAPSDIAPLPVEASDSIVQVYVTGQIKLED